MKKDWRRRVYLSVISLSVLVMVSSSCAFREQPTNILHSKPVKQGWRTRSAIHSKAIDPTTTKEILHVEHCDKHGKQLWMNYHFRSREWRIVEPFNASCGELP
tara:strand:+ start:167 stop:475 length:309 start_codon:yes stop_codon:yes gene_type:complete